MIRDFPTGNAPALHAAAQAWMSGEHPEPSALRPAATVMIVRDGSGGELGSGSGVRDGGEDAGVGGVEVFMLRRVATMDFAPSTMVFPGGGVDSRDDQELPWTGPAPIAWAARLGADPDAARMLVVAAVREAFEECGVLFASETEHGPLVEVASSQWQQRRAGLVARELSLAQVLREHQLWLRTDLLRAHAHWVTPVFEPKRFDTRFFVAMLPAGATLDGHTSEADHSGWFRAREVLDDFAGHRAILLPPTQVCLEDIAEAASAAEFFAQEPVIRRLAPELLLDGGEAVLRVDLTGTPAPQ